MRDKVVIITGASSGIGKALAYELAHQGAKVVLAARNIEELLHIEQDLRQQGAEVLSVRTDVTKELACIEQIFKIYNKNWGKLRLEYLSYNLYYVNNNILK